MPPKAVDSAFTGTINGIKPTESDMKIMCAIMENLTAPIQVDAEGAAKSAGMKNKKVFGVMYSRFRAKYNLPAPDGTKAATASAASGDATSDGNGSSATAFETPVKKTQSTRKKAATTVASEGSDAGPSLTPTATTTTPGMASLSMADSPDTPSKPPPNTAMTTAGRKRAAAADIDPEDTPAKKARKPRRSAQKEREMAAKKTADMAETEAEAQAIIEAAEAAVAAGWKIGDPNSPPYGQARRDMMAARAAAAADNAAAAGVAADNAAHGVDTAMGGVEDFGGEDMEHGSDAAELLALALEVQAADADAEASAMDGTSGVNYM